MSVIARAMWPTTERLLLAAGLTSGMRCLDLGCGAGDVSLALARLVGASGSVTGVDQDDVKVQFAREDSDGERLSNVEDIDHAGVFSHPHSAALEQFVGLYNRVVRSRGADPEIGPRLPGLFREVGLSELHLSHVQPVYIYGEAKFIHRITLDNIAPALTAAALATDTELEVLARALDAFLTRPDTIVSTPRIFQVWAWRPLA